MFEITRRDLDDIIETAAERGAKKALNAIGLDDEAAVKDVAELRGLMQVWRDARKTALMTVVKTITTALLGVLALGVAIQLGVIGVGRK
jgi:hypothetical protein